MLETTTQWRYVEIFCYEQIPLNILFLLLKRILTIFTLLFSYAFGVLIFYVHILFGLSIEITFVVINTKNIISQLIKLFRSHFPCHLIFVEILLGKNRKKWSLKTYAISQNYPSWLIWSILIIQQKFAFNWSSIWSIQLNSNLYYQ